MIGFGNRFIRRSFITIILIILFWISIIFGGSYLVYHQVNKHGGVSQIIINLGKEIKHISKEINNEN